MDHEQVSKEKAKEDIKKVIENSTNENLNQIFNSKPEFFYKVERIQVGVKNMEDNILYSVHDVAKMLHSSPNYIYKLIDKGYLPAIKLGSIKILKSTLIKFLIDNEGNDLSNINSIKKIESKKVK